MALSIFGSFIVLLFIFALRLLKNGRVNNEPEAIDIPGKVTEEEQPGKVKIIDVKDMPANEFDFTFSERPFNPY